MPAESTAQGPRGPARKARRSSRPRPYTVRLVYAGACLVVLLSSGVFLFDRYTAAPAHGKDCALQVRPEAAEVRITVPTDAYPGRLLQRGGAVNDASCLSRVPVYGVVQPRTEREVGHALAFARAEHLTVSVAGTRHSMGGQAAYRGGLVLDMRAMNHIRIEPSSGTVTVGAGATWQRVLETLHPEGLSVAAMPSIDVLSVGGTVSVNAHGADFRTGSLASTVRSLRLMRADGTIKVLDRKHDPELFQAVIGGYGLFGVILDVELDTVGNELYDFDQRVVPTAAFTDLFEHELVPRAEYRMMYAHLSTSPSSFLNKAIVYTYRTTLDESVSIPPLRQEQDSRIGRLALNLARHGSVAQRLKWAGEEHVLPRFRRCVTSRNEALRAGEACLVSRNQALYNDLGLLRNKLPQYTDILQEYFLPAGQLSSFLGEARACLQAHDAVLLSASIRSVNQGEIMLDYAPQSRLSVVLYLSQKVARQGNRDMASLTRHLVATALDHGGSFYLPYQQHYTREQLNRAYPRFGEFLALKREHDPHLLFNNSLYSRYGRPNPDVASIGGNPG